MNQEEFKPKLPSWVLNPDYGWDQTPKSPPINENSPKHYGNNDLLEFFHKNQVPYLESSAMKYAFRHKKKNGKADIEKAINCLQHILRLEYGVNDSTGGKQLQ